jgi:hypothetical protein
MRTAAPIVNADHSTILSSVAAEFDTVDSDEWRTYDIVLNNNKYNKTAEVTILKKTTIINVYGNNEQVWLLSPAQRSAPSRSPSSTLCGTTARGSPGLAIQHRYPQHLHIVSSKKDNVMR